MASILLAFVILLLLVVALNLTMTFALTRQLRMLEAAAPAAGSLALPVVGERIGNFRVTTIDGEKISERQLANINAIAAFVMPGCEPCHKIVGQLRGGGLPFAGDKFMFVAGESNDAATVELARSLTSIGRVAVISPDGAAAAAFGGVTGYPTLLRLESGIIRSAGRSLTAVAGPSATVLLQ